MALHIALLEPQTPTIAGAVARHCAAADASLHLVGPMGFVRDDPQFRSAGPGDWELLDWWVHPGWRDFREAMSRERCLYFAADAERDPGDAPFRANSVLVFGNEAVQLPERIREKYPDRVFGLPRAVRGKADLAGAVAATLKFASPRSGLPAAAKPTGTPRRRGGRSRRA